MIVEVCTRPFRSVGGILWKRCPPPSLRKAWAAPLPVTIRTTIPSCSSMISRSKTPPGAELGVDAHLLPNEEFCVETAFSRPNFDDDFVHDSTSPVGHVVATKNPAFQLTGQCPPAVHPVPTPHATHASVLSGSATSPFAAITAKGDPLGPEVRGGTGTLGIPVQTDVEVARAATFADRLGETATTAPRSFEKVHADPSMQRGRDPAWIGSAALGLCVSRRTGCRRSQPAVKRATRSSFFKAE